MDKIDFIGKSVLEIGSCDGMFAFEAEKRGAAYVVATDLMPYALDRFLFCKRVLYHLRDPMLGLAQIRSVLKEDGAALIETATCRSVRPVMQFNVDGKGFYPNVTTWWAPSLRCLEAMCRSSGLRVVSGTIPWRYRLTRLRSVGRTGFMAKPMSVTCFSHEYLYSLRMHYPHSLLSFLGEAEAEATVAAPPQSF